MIRLNRMKVFLLLLMVCSLYVSINFYFKSQFYPKQVVKTTEKHLRSEDASVKMFHIDENFTKAIKNNNLVELNSVTRVVNMQQSSINTDNQTVVKLEDKASYAIISKIPSTTATIKLNAIDTTVWSEVQEIQNFTTDEKADVRWCPDKPPFLEGALADMKQRITAQKLTVYYPDFETGGRMRPKDCSPRQRLAIIVPYRNRYSHLHIMMNNLIPMLMRQQLDFTFFVIEQDLPETFNRGALLNIGFLEANKIGHFDCLYFMMLI
uniref:Galactosyltransferase N-terminal domain-containing protein n=1 Tax=Arion vulgaris TaxID=1028688 RepID=A0A0B7ALJ2_9EUPU